MTYQYTLRIQAVRNEMAKLNLDALIIPHEDEYLLEEIPDYNNRLKWLTGFSGTAGVAVILKDKAMMFVDGRYKVQVAEQVDKQLFCVESLSIFEDNSWLQTLLYPIAQIGIDPKLHSFSWFKSFKKILSQENISCITTKRNLIDLYWKRQQPSANCLVTILAEKYHGKPSSLKRQAVAKQLASAKIDCAIITSLDSICWLLNLRGKDIPCLPVFYATALINQNGEVICFTDLTKISATTKNSFDVSVNFRCKTTLDSYLLSLTNSVIQIDSQTINASMVSLLIKEDVKIIERSDPIILLKSQKNAIELSGFKACHLRDGSAVIHFLSWLNNKVNHNIFYDEAILANKLESFRAKDSLYQQPSFDTVSAIGSNGAMCHYNHKDSTANKITNDSIYLVDSGGHYLDGSTDVTRTIAIGNATNKQIKMATLVLKGHIALATMKFPYGTTGQHLDAFARQYLWQHGYDYEHGTGHGVGHSLNVHEGPQRIAKYNSSAELLPSMVVSIEPGYYQQGEFGIRHENLYFVKECTMSNNSTVPMLQFEVLTFVPFDSKLINTAMLNDTEINWLNHYHQLVYDRISPLIGTCSRNWLAQATQAL